MNMTPAPDPPPAGSPPGSTLTAEEIAAIRTLNAQRDSECPWLMRTAEIRWQLERVARDAIIPALDMIEARDRENAALRDRLALVEGALRLCDDDSVATYLRQEARIKALEGAAAILTAATREVIQRVPNTAVGRLTEAIREYDALLTTPTAPSDGAAWAGDAE